MSEIKATASGLQLISDATGDIVLNPSGSLTVPGFTVAAGKTLTVNKTLTIDGVDGDLVDFNALIRSCYQGLILTYVGTTSFSVGVGAVGDSTFAATMVLAATTTKTTSAWAVGSGNGGLDTGAIGASTWYAVYLIKRPDTGVVDVIYSTNGTSPSLPANYTLYRRIGWVRTNGSSQFIQWQQIGRQFNWMAKVADLNAGTPANTNRILVTVTAPKSTIGLLIIGAQCTTSFSLDAGWTALTDSAASSTNEILLVPSGGGAYTSLEIPVDASNQIYYRVSATSGNTVTILTQGWIDNL